jgi:hypothetical protein
MSQVLAPESMGYPGQDQVRPNQDRRTQDHRNQVHPNQVHPNQVHPNQARLNQARLNQVQELDPMDWKWSHISRRSCSCM